MTYNKARAEHKWRKWKDAEEKILREQGIDEAAIQALRQRDWDDFKSERRFLERWKASGDFVEHQSGREESLLLHNIQELTDNIEDEELLILITD